MDKIAYGEAGASAVAVSLDAPLPVAETALGHYYSVMSLAYAAYDTPTAFFTLACPAGKRLRVKDIRLMANASAATLMTFNFLVRSTANTGGTATTLTPVKRDSASPDPTAVAKLYSAAPTLGSLLKLLSSIKISVAASTAAPTAVAGISSANSAIVLWPDIVLNEGETLEINGDSAAKPAGFLAQVAAIWIEEAA